MPPASTRSGNFVGDTWQEWNGRFRDDVRRFVKGDNGSVPAHRRPGCSAARTCYGHEEREAEQSINFVTCHDGFTLNDLVSYNRKHNEANGEDNRDGSDDNLSWNCGAEGPTGDPAIEALRNRQVKNFMALTMLAAGTPMLLMGDEVRRTQRGNNNAYCHDGDISWFDWTLLEQHPDIHRFVKMLNAFRQRRDVVAEEAVLSLNELLRRSQIAWHGVALERPDWGDPSHSLAFTLRSLRGRFLLHVMLNAYWEPLTFEMPPLPPDIRSGGGAASIRLAPHRTTSITGTRLRRSSHLAYRGRRRDRRSFGSRPARDCLIGELAWHNCYRRNSDALTADETPLATDELELMDAFWRACNYLSVGMIYLKDNPAAERAVARPST